MNIRKINHIGIVVDNLARSKQTFGEGLGLPHLKDESVEEFHCKIAFFQCGEVMIELIEPTGPGPSDAFLRSHGEGIHHICYEVEDIHAALEQAKERLATDYDQPKSGAGGSQVFFLDPKSCCHVETEFVQPAAPPRA